MRTSLIEARKSAGMTQEVSELAGIFRSFYTEIETNKETRPYELLNALHPCWMRNRCPFLS